MTPEQHKEKFGTTPCQETLICKYCEEDDFIEQEELDEHQQKEHPFEYHDDHCSYFDVKKIDGELQCQNCALRWGGPDGDGPED